MQIGGGGGDGGGKSVVYLQKMGGAGGGRLGLKVGFLAHNLDYRCDNLSNLCLLLCMVDY